MEKLTENLILIIVFLILIFSTIQLILIIKYPLSISYTYFEPVRMVANITYP